MVCVELKQGRGSNAPGGEGESLPGGSSVDIVSMSLNLLEYKSLWYGTRNF